MRLLILLLGVVSIVPVDAMGQTAVSQRVPMTSRWDLMQLQALRLQHPDVRTFQATVEGTYPVAWMGGRSMVGFVGALLPGAEAMGYEAMSAWAPAVRVGSRSGAVVSFRVDIDHLDVLEALPLAQWHLAAMAAPDLEKARYGTRVDSVQAGLGLPQAYTGEGVLIGVLDWGFDYTHPMFYDSLLNASRVRAVWDQYRQVGPGPADFGYGRVAEEPSDIASLASDTANIYGFAYHGTHVAGIAGGAGAGTALVGMAPGAELVFTTFLIDEAAAMDAFAWMQDIAEADGKRLVINNSWSLPEFGTRDGQGLFNQFIDSMSEEGVVFVASAGNNGSKDYHIAHAFSGDILRSRVQFYPESANPSMWGQALTLWGEAGASFEAGIALTSMGSNIVHESPWFSTADGPMMLDTALVFEGDTLPVELIVEEAHPANGRPFIRMRVRKSGSSLGVGLQVTAPSGTVHCWNTTHLSNGVGNWGQDFQSPGAGWTAGDPHFGVQTPACSERVIAVAAYYSEYLNPLGNEGGGTLASFSSYGPTLDGRLKPEIAAPGVSVESSMSAYTDASFNVTEEVEFNGVTYPFAKLSGTSMSGPAVAGIVALMLEANPDLTVDEVREALRVTARQDDHTGEITEEGSTVWGWGKVNAVRAVQEVLGINGVAEAAPMHGQTDLFQVWPNPVADDLNVASVQRKGAVDWEVVDPQGRKVDEGAGVLPLRLNSDAWPKGALLLRLWMERGEGATYRIVVE